MHGCFNCISMGISTVCVFLFIAYQLRVCQPPTNIPNAEILAEDDEFEIGNVKEDKSSICLKTNKTTKNGAINRSLLQNAFNIFEN